MNLVNCALVWLLGVTNALPHLHRHKRGEPKECVEPSHLSELRTKVLAPARVHSSLYGLPFFRAEEMDVNDIGDKHESSDIIIGDRACPSEINTSSDRDVERSTCPIYHVITYDKDRIPATIVEAQCKCTHCISLTQDMNCGPDVKPKLKAECRKIYYYTPVFRKTGCNNKTMEYEYQRVFEPVSVGCTCVHPKHRSSRVMRRGPKPAIGFNA